MTHERDELKIERFGLIDEASGYEEPYFGATVDGKYVLHSDYEDMRRERDEVLHWYDEQLARAEAAEAKLAKAVEALKPFSDMAGEMFARGWDASNVAIALDNPGDPHRVTAGDFFAARTTLQAIGEDNAQ